MEKQRCKKCGETKGIEEYYGNKGMLSGRVNECKECVKKRVRKYGQSIIGRIRDKRRNQTSKRKKWLIKYQRKKRKENTLKYHCYNKFWYAILNGKIRRAERCRWCPSKKDIEGHHKDYNKPYEVEWLCKKCHRKLHKQFQRQKN